MVIECWPVRPRLNGQITASAVNVITEEGAPLGILPTTEALKLVASRREDLVEIGTILGMSDLTEKQHLGDVFAKLGVEGRNPATLRALEVLAQPSVTKPK